MSNSHFPSSAGSCDEPHAAIIVRLEDNWQRHSARIGEALMRLIACQDSGADVNLSGIDRDLIVYAMARTFSVAQAVPKSVKEAFDFAFDLLGEFGNLYGSSESPGGRDIFAAVSQARSKILKAESDLAAQPPTAPVETEAFCTFPDCKCDRARVMGSGDCPAGLPDPRSSAATGNDEVAAKLINQYLGMSDIDAEDAAYFRAVLRDTEPQRSAATEGVVGLEVLRHMADRQRGIGMPPKPMMRPSGSNADEWNVFLEEYTGHGNSFIAVQIAEAIEDAEKRGTLNEPQGAGK